MTVMRWIDGDVLPDTWLHLKSLVRAMGATDHEVDAFQQAYTRTVDAHLPGLASPTISPISRPPEDWRESEVHWPAPGTGPWPFSAPASSS